MLNMRRTSIIQSPPWWLAGGIPRTTCLAAYQPKGASSLAGSYTNLATPGINNAAPGVAPTWDVVNGWKFNGSSQYLKTGVIPSTNHSLIVLFSNCIIATAVLTGNYTDIPAQATFEIMTNYSSKVWYFAGGYIGKSASPTMTNGTLAIAGLNFYRNGILDATQSAPGTIPAHELYIGARNNKDTTVTLFNSVYVQAAAFYSIDITSYIAALNAAINAL
jgi:hypothetical protein